jgi:ATP-dependent helicase/nuclease subunit B
MAVQFVLGRSGTGKTSYCVREIADALLEPSEQPLLFLVPEQATYQAERAILCDPRIQGYHRLHILSFDRLQFLLLGKNTARPAISRIGRQMIVHKTLRDNLDKLQIFGSSALLPGFAREMASTITELHQYAKSAEDIEGLLEYLQEGGRKTEDGGRTADRDLFAAGPANANRLSGLKFADIALVFRRYMEALEDKFVDPDAQIAAACRAVGKAKIIRGARLWMDGFASFTGAEMALLIEVLKAVNHAHIALCFDPADCTQTSSVTRPGLFEPTARTYGDMLDRLAEAKIKVGTPLCLDHVGRFAECPALAHVEQNVFRLGADKAKAGGDIRLVAAPSLRLEIQFVARQILSLVRDKGYRYCDIAVVASDLGQYEQYVRAYFEDYGIPFFIDKRKPLSQHPVIELVCAALQAVIGRPGTLGPLRVSQDRSGPPGRLRHRHAGELLPGVRRRWAGLGVGEPWRFKELQDEQFDEERINKIREQAVRPLLELRAALCPGGGVEKKLTASEFTRVVFAFLDRLEVRRTVGQWVAQAHQDNDPATADEHRQFFDTFVDIFDTLVEIFERQEMTVQDYFGLLASAFSQMTLAFIPPKLDQVLVGSIERSRHPNLKAIFLLGATQKQFPIPLAHSGVLTDEDRDAAEAADFELAPSSTQSLIDRQYLAYIAFTRPSKFMCISYPCVDEKGSPIMRSHFIDELQSLFEDVAEEFIEDNLPGLSEVQSRPELGELLCCRLGRDFSSTAVSAVSTTGILPVDVSENHGRDAHATHGQDARATAGLLRAMQADDEYREMSCLIVSALGYENRAHLEPSVAKELFGRRLHGSATRLATFAACPYRHFVRYVLDLKPRREFKLEPLDLGQFYHALDALQKRLAAEKQDSRQSRSRPPRAGPARDRSPGSPSRIRSSRSSPAAPPTMRSSSPVRAGFWRSACWASRRWCERVVPAAPVRGGLRVVRPSPRTAWANSSCRCRGPGPVARRQDRPAGRGRDRWQEGGADPRLQADHSGAASTGAASTTGSTCNSRSTCWPSSLRGRHRRRGRRGPVHADRDDAESANAGGVGRGEAPQVPVQGPGRHQRRLLQHLDANAVKRQRVLQLLRDQGPAAVWPLW